jgi:hypothetical protein
VVFSWFQRIRCPRGLLQIIRIISLPLIVSVLHGCTVPGDQADLYGAWTGSGATIPLIEVEFLENNDFRMHIVTRKGDNFVYDGQFEVDFSKYPAPLTLRGIPKLPYAIHTIVELRDRETLRMGAFAEKWRLRPTDFNPTNVMTLKKKDSSGS